MARIAGVDLPNKHVDVALTYIYGLGPASARKICATTGIDPTKRINDLSAEEVNRLRDGHRERLQGRGPPAHRDLAQHQAPDGHRLLPGPPPPARAAGARPAHADQRAHPQGQAQDRGREAEGDSRRKEEHRAWQRPRRKRRKT